MPRESPPLPPSHPLPLLCPQQQVPASRVLPVASSLPTGPTAQGRQDLPGPGYWEPRRGMGGDVCNGQRGLPPIPSSGGEEGPQSWGLGLPLALGLDLKEKRLMRRREKLPAFFRTLGAAVVLERSSCDWLRPASFCRGFRRKMSFVPLRRKLTVGEEGRLRQRRGEQQGWGRVGGRERTRDGGSKTWNRTVPGPGIQASLGKKVETKHALHPS